MKIDEIEEPYDSILSDLSALLEKSRRLAARSVNAVMTATYREIGRRIVEVEQNGEVRAEYGEEFWVRLSADLTNQFGRCRSKIPVAVVSLRLTLVMQV